MPATPLCPVPDRFLRGGLAALTLLVAALLPAAAQDAGDDSAYRQPSAAIRSVLDAPALPQYLVAPDQRTLAILHWRRDRSVADLARPVLRLAGMRFDAKAHSPHLTPRLDGLRLRDLAGGTERVVPLPPGALHGMRWSPDGRRYLLLQRTDDALRLWVGSAEGSAPRLVPGLALHGLFEREDLWLSEHEIVVNAVPQQRGPAPSAAVPTGPAVQESLGRASPERTLQDLLRTPQDEALFRHHARSVLARVDLQALRWQEIGEPALFTDVKRLGTGDRLLTERLDGPFGYQTGWWDFGRSVEVRDLQGRVLREVTKIQRRLQVPALGVVPGPRQVWASPAEDGALYWAEALDGGNPARKVPHRDRLMRLDPPYDGAPREVHKTVSRLTRLSMIEGGRAALATSVDRDRARLLTELVALDGAAPPRTLDDRPTRDRYGDPGTPLTRVGVHGRRALRLDGGALWLSGVGASKDGDRPFLDRLDLASGQTTRLFQSGDTHFERPLAALDVKSERMLTLRESLTEPPHVVLRSGPQLAQSQTLVSQADPAPLLRQIRRERVRLQRADGVELSFWLYLPPDHRPGERRPTLVWAYPLEFTDGDTAGQISGSDDRFVSVGGTSPVLLALDGYVVLMDATMPVVGDPKTVNDSFVAQITANAQAIVDKAVELGVSERGRIAVGGHSYGAFMTANLLAHTDLFAAGIARSGAYNRSLTPFGFQSERRNYWDAQAVYQKLSPFNYANRLKEPLLLIHGDADENAGTHPMQSQRLHQALAGTGGKVRHVALPFEGHGYSARESIGHVLWEMSDWMRRHVGEGRALGPATARP